MCDLPRVRPGQTSHSALGCERAPRAGAPPALPGDSLPVTARGLAYLGDGLSHAAFGGIALGMFMGLTSPLFVAIPFTAVAAMAIGALRRRGGLRSDVAMAILFAVYAVRLVLQSHEFNDMSTSNDATPLWIPQLSMAVGAVVFAIAAVDEFFIEWNGRAPVADGEMLRHE